MFFLVTYVAPLILMGICYTRMGIHLWGSRIIGEESETLRRNYQNKKKVIFFFIFFLLFLFSFFYIESTFSTYFHDWSSKDQKTVEESNLEERETIGIKDNFCTMKCIISNFFPNLILVLKFFSSFFAFFFIPSPPHNTHQEMQCCQLWRKKH